MQHPLIDSIKKRSSRDKAREADIWLSIRILKCQAQLLGDV